MTAALAVLAASVALYVVGIGLWMSWEARRIRRLPDSWRHHPELSATYDAALSRTWKSIATSPDWAGVAWLAAIAVVFALFGLAEIELGLQLVVAAVAALAWTVSEMSQSAEATRAFARQHSLPVPPGRIRRHWPAYVARGATWLGFTGGACAAGNLVVLAAT